MGGEVYVPLLALIGVLIIVLGCCGSASWADDQAGEGEGRTPVDPGDDR